MIIDNYINLGKTEIMISQVGLGIMQWGNFDLDPDSDSINQEVREIFQTSLENGINFFDTAEMYGNGRSEIHLGRCLESYPNKLIIATKFFPFPWRFSKGELKKALLRSLSRLKLASVDLYQMHWPFPPVSISSWMDAMADLVADGLIRSVGVSNYSPDQTIKAFETLDRHHIPLASNQIKYSLLDRRPEQSNLMEVCRKLGVTVIAYSPLEKGILSGKYNTENLPSGFRAQKYNKKYLFKVKPLLVELQKIGNDHQGKSPSQVALNWLICKGAVPIPGARDKQQARENAGCIGWKLSGEEESRLDQLSTEVIRLL